MPVSTVLFSNHTGYGAWRGPLISGETVRDIVTGIEERGALEGVDVVLSGYQGGEDIADAILFAVERVKAASSDAIYSCDPVMGNAESGCFVKPEIPVLLRDRVVPKADLISPNQFELGFLTGTSPDTLDSTLESIDLAMGMGPRNVLVTSVQRPDSPEGTIEMIAATQEGVWVVQKPHLPLKANGSGDVTQALFAAHYARTGDAAYALGRTAASMFELLENTLNAGSRELQLVQSQEAFVNPAHEFPVSRVR